MFRRLDYQDVNADRYTDSLGRSIWVINRLPIGHDYITITVSESGDEDMGQTVRLTKEAAASLAQILLEAARGA